MHSFSAIFVCSLLQGCQCMTAQCQIGSNSLEIAGLEKHERQKWQRLRHVHVFQRYLVDDAAAYHSVLDQTEHLQDIAKLLSLRLTMGDKQPAVVVIAGTSSSVGKSTVSLGLMALFRWDALTTSYARPHLIPC